MLRFTAAVTALIYPVVVLLGAAAQQLRCMQLLQSRPSEEP
jgi:hypothetical protein